MPWETGKTERIDCSDFWYGIILRTLSTDARITSTQRLHHHNKSPQATDCHPAAPVLPVQVLTKSIQKTSDRVSHRTYTCRDRKQILSRSRRVQSRQLHTRVHLESCQAKTVFLEMRHYSLQYQSSSISLAGCKGNRAAYL